MREFRNKMDAICFIQMTYKSFLCIVIVSHGDTEEKKSPFQSLFLCLRASV